MCRYPRHSAFAFDNGMSTVKMGGLKRSTTQLITITQELTTTLLIINLGVQNF